MAVKATALAGALLALSLIGPAAAAQEAPFAPPASGKFTIDPGATTAPLPPTPPGADSDTWIFSGVLDDSNETFSGTLVTGKADTEFELKLADGATCDGGDLHPSALGLVRLSEIRCTDDRTMRALFVPQGHETLKVFGHVGDARFATVAHLLGTKPIPEPKQTAEPQAPLRPEPTEPPPLPPSGPKHDPGDDPG